MDEVLANGHCQMTRRELAERAGVSPHIVQRTDRLHRNCRRADADAVDRASKIEILDPGWLARAKQLGAGAIASGE